jgi:hypothetical protein
MLHFLGSYSQTLIFALLCFTVINRVFYINKIQKIEAYTINHSKQSLIITMPLKCYLYHQKNDTK